jgi:hypothetical protein
VRSLASRLDRIERFQPPCPKCGGEGKYAPIELMEFDPEPPIDPREGCEVCGKVARFYVRWVNEAPVRLGVTTPSIYD